MAFFGRTVSNLMFWPLLFGILLFGCQSNSMIQCEASENAQVCLQTAIQKVADVEGALSLCGQVSDVKLRGECFFLISDGYELVGDKAMSICARAEPFTEDCQRHAAARDVEVNIFSTLTHATPQPMKLMPRIYGTVQRYLPDQIAESMSRDMMIRFQAGKIGEQFSRDACTGLNPSICAQVYIVASLGSRDQWSEYVEEPWMKDCGTDLTLAAATRWGWKSWTPSMEATVQQAYSQLCAALQGQQPRD